MSIANHRRVIAKILVGTAIVLGAFVGAAAPASAATNPTGAQSIRGDISPDNSNAGGRVPGSASGADGVLYASGPGQAGEIIPVRCWSPSICR